MTIRKLNLKEGAFNEVFTFANCGDRINARFIGREKVKTKKQDAAPVLHCDIVESTVAETGGNEEYAGPSGIHTIFESTHITQLLDEAKLEYDDFFILQFCSTGKNNFKKFALEKESAPNEDRVDGSELLSDPSEASDDKEFFDDGREPDCEVD